MKFIQFSLFTVLGLLMAATSAQAATFSDQQIKDHPCLDKASLPWKISPVKAADVPEAYKGWAGLWAGLWGSQLCHVLVIKNITESGKASITYSTGQPYPEFNEFIGTITTITNKKGKDRQQLEVILGNGVPVKYTLRPVAGNDLSYQLNGVYQGSPQPSRGLFSPVKNDN